MSWERLAYVPQIANRLLCLLGLHMTHPYDSDLNIFSSSFFCGVLSIISKGVSEKSSRSDALALFVELSLFSRLLKVNS